MPLTGGKKVTLTYDIPTGCALDSLQLFTFSGIGFQAVQTATKDGNTFTFQVDKGKPTFYFVGPDATALKSVILGSEKAVMMTSECDNYKMAAVKKSNINKEYATYLNERRSLNNRSAEVIKQYLQTQPEDVDQRNALNADLATIDADRLKETKRYKSDFVNKIAALFAYQSYQNNKGEYEVEMDYFADNFFSQVDFSDKAYDQMSVVYEAFSTYTTTLTQARFPKEKHESILLNALSKLDDTGMAYKYALGAVVNNLYSRQHPNMPAFATIYVNKYYETDKEELGALKLVVDQINANTIGAPAPDIVMNNPENEEVALSSLKGKVVLIDFWASWCGPCRRENPNVVKMYEKYKDHGFEIFGVSLDSSKDRWVQAIEADKLTWPHVSDLKGWKSSPAQVYGVRSIPTTVLVDAEGKILARNLRGPSLEAKLEEIFD